jgi:hypothetical protein
MDVGEVWAGRACVGANQQELTTCAKKGGQEELFFAKGGFRAPSCSQRAIAGRRLALYPSNCGLFFKFFWKVWGMGQAFWENGYTTPSFFEACPYIWKCWIFDSSWSLEISFFSKFFWLKLEDTWTFISTIGIFVLWKIEITKNSLRIASVWNLFVSFFNVRCIWVCSTHDLPLRFGTQVLNMMCITMVEKLKVAYFKTFTPKAVKVCYPCQV